MHPTNYTQLKKKHHKKLTGFTRYLQSLGYHPDTISTCKNYISTYLEWLQDENISVQQVSYNDLLSYIRHNKTQGNSSGLNNRKLASVRKYYEYLQQTDEHQKNPASALYIKNKKHPLPKSHFTRKELHELYKGHPEYDLRTRRNKSILSLVINQGLSPGELNRLEPAHIKLKTGKLEVSGNKSTATRTLKLEAFQILELQEYLQEVRPQILQLHKHRAALQHKLFISMKGASSLKSTLLYLVRNLKQQNPKVESLTQLRQNVITEWLKTEDLRQVQYKAGHKKVSTTERYQANNLEDLQEALKQYHPLK